MNEIEKRELIEQQRKILETGTQRADRRSGFFSFLTWPFFIAPLFASEDFLAATQKARAGEPEDLKAHSASLSLQAANTPASDSRKRALRMRRPGRLRLVTAAHRAVRSPRIFFSIGSCAQAERRAQ